MPRGEGDWSDVKLVDFYAAGCPHCKSLDPVWEKAEKHWDGVVKHSEEPPQVSFVKKECYDSSWQPGKDYAECKKFHIKAFPSIKLFAPAASGHGFSVQSDYDGKRTAEAISDFLKKETDLEPTPQAAAEQAQAQDQMADIYKNAKPVVAVDAHAKHAAPSLPEEEQRDEAGLDVLAKAHPDIKAVVHAGSEAAQAAQKAAAEIEALLGGPEHKQLAVPEPTDAATEDVKSAMIPLPLISCAPVYRKRPSARPARHAPPAARTQFL